MAAYVAVEIDSDRLIYLLSLRVKNRHDPNVMIMLNNPHPHPGAGPCVTDNQLMILCVQRDSDHAVVVDR
ncbi:hypothetical protein X011_26865 [Mycobacterium tuberculosis variant microti OV254]|nr:hypothetical protein X011_26865 [Mycobacterium tuberculosis variant microti OV254]